MIRDAIATHLSEVLGEPVRLGNRSAVSGGCIHETVRVSSDRGHVFFIKLNDAARLSVLEAEAEGLRELKRADAIRVPEVFCHGQVDNRAYLVLEFIEMRRDGDERARGRQLAALHRQRGDRFGWKSDNFIGETPQVNGWVDSWCAFFRENRLRFQGELARRNGLRLPDFDDLLERLPEFFSSYSPVPSLLHGDLWGGNAAFDETGAPVIFDPAVYYGDRETDLAFSEFFGGFGADFYRNYTDEWPLEQGHEVRKRLYNLYHELNHYNIFGGHYGRQAESTVRSLLSEVR